MSATDRSELDGYEALVSELRANPPVAPERLRQRVLEGAPAPRRRMSRKRRLVLVVVPAAVVLAVGAALVHGFVSSGSHPQSALGADAGAALRAALRFPSGGVHEDTRASARDDTCAEGSAPRRRADGSRQRIADRAQPPALEALHARRS